MSISPKSLAKGTSTVVKSINYLYSSLNLEMQLMKDTTINFKYRNFNGEDPSKVPVVLYGGIGIRGSYNIDDEDGIGVYDPSPADLDLYRPLPFRCVPIDEDLSTSERMNYRMRVLETYNGQQYYSYYLKLLKPVDNEVIVTRFDPVSKTEVPYVLNSANLTPTPIKPVELGEVETPTEILTYSRVLLPISGAEVYEAINVIYNGDLTKARISEYGLYSGEDRLVTGYTSGGGQIQYTEAIYTQLAHKYCTGGVSVFSPDFDLSQRFLLGTDSSLFL